MSSASGDSERFREAVRRFDAENARDPNHDATPEGPRPRELLYAARLTHWVLRLCPEASEALRLAARSQHLCRWMIPRASYPMGRAGYLRWRAELKAFHAAKSGEILREVGYSPELVERVQALNRKQEFPADPETRVLEDALCLVFLEHQLADLADRTDPDTVVNAVRKSWSKMTEQGRAEALRLSFGPRERELLARALAGAGESFPPDAIQGG
jgi:hypothetical protein